MNPVTCSPIAELLVFYFYLRKFFFFAEVEELEHHLTFDAVLMKIGQIQSTGSRSIALRLLLGLPKPPRGTSSQDRTRPTSTTSTGRAHHAMLVKVCPVLLYDKHVDQ